MTEDVLIVGIIFGSLSLVLYPLARAWARRISGGAVNERDTVPADVTERLERIERAVESVAVEVERISEGQRFVTKVLADRGEIAKLPSIQH
jgi:hypothetical protein